MKVSDEKLNRFISKHMLDYRLRHSLSQEGMAEQLNIAPRCYLEQENGRCGFSGQNRYTYRRFSLIKKLSPLFPI